VGETLHRFGVVLLWEQDALPLLENPALLPLATSAAAHLALVAERVVAATCWQGWAFLKN